MERDKVTMFTTGNEQVTVSCPPLRHYQNTAGGKERAYRMRLAPLCDY